MAPHANGRHHLRLIVVVIVIFRRPENHSIIYSSTPALYCLIIVVLVQRFTSQVEFKVQTHVDILTVVAVVIFLVVIVFLDLVPRIFPCSLLSCRVVKVYLSGLKMEKKKKSPLNPKIFALYKLIVLNFTKSPKNS